MERIIIIIEKAGTGIGIAILAFILLACVPHLDNYSQQQEIKKMRKSETLSLSDLALYSGAGADISLQSEITWIRENASEVEFGTWGLCECERSKGKETCDDAFESAKYNLSYYSNYSTNNQNEASYIIRHLDEEFSTFNLVLFLEKEDVNRWNDSEYCNMQGFCFIFGDDRLLYQSPVLTPDNPTTQFVELDISGIDELVIFIVGSAHMCNSYVTR